MAFDSIYRRSSFWHDSVHSLTTERHIAVLPTDVRIHRVAPRTGRIPRIRIAAEVDDEGQCGHGEVLVLIGVRVGLRRVPALTCASRGRPWNGPAVFRPCLGRSTAWHIETCMGMRFPVEMEFPWNSHGNGNKNHNSMGMGLGTGMISTRVGMSKIIIIFQYCTKPHEWVLSYIYGSFQKKFPLLSDFKRNALKYFVFRNGNGTGCIIYGNKTGVGIKWRIKKICGMEIRMMLWEWKGIRIGTVNDFTVSIQVLVLVLVGPYLIVAYLIQDW